MVVKRSATVLVVGGTRYAPSTHPQKVDNYREVRSKNERKVITNLQPPRRVVEVGQEDKEQNETGEVVETNPPTNKNERIYDETKKIKNNPENVTNKRPPPPPRGW